MKTRNNVQKAITKSMAVVISLVLISITVNAQEFWKTILTGNGFSHIAYAMAETETTPVEYYASNAGSEAADLTAMIATEEEELLEMEDWMTESETFYHSMDIINESDSELEIESWMTSESLFSGMKSTLETEPDNALELENWMMDDASFKIRRIVVMDENDPMLKLENWMVNPNIWKI